MKMISLLAGVVAGLTSLPSWACSLESPIREPTLPEMIGGLKEIYGGTVIGYVTDDGTELIGPLPKQCLDDYGSFDWPTGVTTEHWLVECEAYLRTRAAVFRVDVPIVAPAEGDTATYFMTWGDGDCNIDFQIGEKWLIAGYWFRQQLRAPIRENEIAILRRLAARPSFDFSKLYPPHN